jgi:hypothetical protein
MGSGCVADMVLWYATTIWERMAARENVAMVTARGARKHGKRTEKKALDSVSRGAAPPDRPERKTSGS